MSSRRGLVSFLSLIEPDIREQHLAAAHNILINTPVPVDISTATSDADPATVASARSTWVLSALTRLSTVILGVDEPIAPLKEKAALLVAYAATNGLCEMRLSRALQARRKTAECEEVKRCWVSWCETCAMIRQRGCRNE